MEAQSATANTSEVSPVINSVAEIQITDTTVSTTVQSDSNNPITASITVTQPVVATDLTPDVSFTVTSPGIEPLANQRK